MHKFTQNIELILDPMVTLNFEASQHGYKYWIVSTALPLKLSSYTTYKVCDTNI